MDRQRHSMSRLALGAFCLVIFCAIFFVPKIKADTASDLQQQIDAQNQSIASLDAEIAGYQSQLTTLGKQKNTLANALQTLTLESKKLATDAQVTQAKIDAANLQLDSLGTSIESAGTAITQLKAALGKNLEEINEAESTTLPELLAQGANLSDVWHAMAEADMLEKSLGDRTQELAATKQTLVVNQTSVQATKESLIALESQLKDQQIVNQKTVAEKNTLLKSTNNQESSYQKLIAQKESEEAQMETDMRAYEAKLKYVLTPGSLPVAGSSPFAWPLDKIVITQLFGKTSASGRLYATGTHNGVDFGTPIGTPVKAMASGVVVDSGNADLTCKGASYGIWVFIKYDNGLASVYGHLSLSKVKGGERVATGDIVAYSGMTGYATGPHLHVSVFPNDAVKVTTFNSVACPGKTITIPTAAVNAYLDPMIYMPKTGAIYAN